MNGGKLFSKLIAALWRDGEEGWDGKKSATDRESRFMRGAGFGPLTQGPIVLLGNEGTKGTGGVHLILVGGRSLRRRETPTCSFICCAVSLGRH